MVSCLTTEDFDDRLERLEKLITAQNPNGAGARKVNG
jgi:hypothetical protein